MSQQREHSRQCRPRGSLAHPRPTRPSPAVPPPAPAAVCPPPARRPGPQRGWKEGGLGATRKLGRTCSLALQLLPSIAAPRGHSRAEAHSQLHHRIGARLAPPPSQHPAKCLAHQLGKRGLRVEAAKRQRLAIGGAEVQLLPCRPAAQHVEGAAAGAKGALPAGSEAGAKCLV